eukprot:scaffold27675_cov223-Amphora_coffeaeformis.AAC.1
MSHLILASPEDFRRPPRRIYSVSTKVKVLHELSQNSTTSLGQVARDNEINKSVLIRWKQQQHDILTTAEKKGASASNVSGAGRPSRIPKAVKDGLMSFINERRSKNLSVSPRMVYYEWCRLDPEDVFTLTESAARQRIYRFMR